MSFSRVNPGGWAIGDPLTSAQQNQLDIDHAVALKGGTAPGTLTDTIWTQLSFGTGGKLTANSAGQIIVNASTALVSQATNGIQLAAVGALETTVDGGIALNGSVADWLTYGTTRTYLTHESLINGGVIVGAGPTTLFSYTGDNLSGLAASVNPGYFPISAYHNSTLTKATLYFAVGASHGSVPAFFPKFGVFARSPSGNVGIAPSNPLPLLSTGSGFVTATAGSGPAWFAGGVVQSLDFIPNQNNVIDITNLRYFVALADESGTGSAAGNLYLGVRLTFSAIATSQPG